MIEIDPTPPNKEFIDEMNSSIIPAVETLVEKEIEHQAHLKKQLEKLNDTKAFNFNRFWSQSPIHLIEDFLTESDKMLKHYQSRLKEYKDYVTKHTK